MFTDGRRILETGAEGLAQVGPELTEVSDAFYIYLGTIPPRRIKKSTGIKWDIEGDETGAALREHQESLKQLGDKQPSTIGPMLHTSVSGRRPPRERVW